MAFATIGAAQATSFAPDYGKAKLAATRLFAILDRKPLIDIAEDEGYKLVSVSQCLVSRGFKPLASRFSVLEAQ